MKKASYNGYYYSAAAMRLLMDHVVGGIPDREPVEVINIAELNVAGRNVVMFNFETTLELDVLASKWESEYYWGFQPETGVVAAWERKDEKPRTYVFRLLSKDTSPKRCIEAARGLIENRKILEYRQETERITSRPPLNSEGTRSTREWDDCLSTLWEELDKIRALTEEQTTKVNERGPRSLESSALHSVCADLIEARKELEKYFE